MVARLQSLDEVFAQVEAQPYVTQIDEREERHARRDIFAKFGADLIDLRGDRRLDRKFVDLGLGGVDRGLRLEDIGARDAALLRGGAGDGFLIGELRLIQSCAGRPGDEFVTSSRRWSGALPVRGQLLDAIVSLLGEREIRRCAFDRGLALRDLLGARTGQDIGELGGGDRQSSFRLLKLRHQFRIVDFVQQLTSGDIVAALNRALADPAVDARCDVDARGVRFSLNDQWLRLHKIPERQANDRRDNKRNDKGRRPRDPGRSRNSRRRCLCNRQIHVDSACRHGRFFRPAVKLLADRALPGDLRGLENRALRAAHPIQRRCGAANKRESRRSSSSHIRKRWPGARLFPPAAPRRRAA